MKHKRINPFSRSILSSSKSADSFFNKPKSEYEHAMMQSKGKSINTYIYIYNNFIVRVYTKPTNSASRLMNHQSIPLFF